MKLLLLTSNYPFGNLGDNCFIQNEIYALAEKFDNITIISTGDGKLREDIPANLKVVKVNQKKFKIFKAFNALFALFNKSGRQAFKECKKYYKNASRIKIYKQLFIYNYVYFLLKNIIKKEGKDADLVYTYWMSSKAYAVAKLKFDKKINCPFITRSHRFDCYIRNDYILVYRKFIGDNVDTICFISEDGKNYYERTFYQDLQNKCNLVVSYLGINKNFTETNYSEDEYLRIVSCSNVVPVKRLDILINALSMIDDFKISWIHIGGGEKFDEITKFAEEKLAKKENIKYHFKGALKNEEILNYYKNNTIDLFINCSDSEGVPVTIMEANSFGIPVICRDVGGNREICVGNNKDYLLPKNAGAEDFAKAIIDFKNKSYEEKIKRREETKSIFQKYFSKEAVKKFSQLLTCYIKKI